EGKVDALSGATITTKAVTEAVNAALTYVNQYMLTGEEG
ncbi:MAG: FMN-binding protein, partial [Clostridia bacterium]|nr:FMN-binding protein [Clostridia bacterium]